MIAVGENETKSDHERTFIIAALKLFGLSLVCVLVAGLTKLIAWPVVTYTVKSALVLALLGGTGASLRMLFRRSKHLFLKAFLILVSIAYLVVVWFFLTLWLFPSKPEMSTVENNVLNLVSILSGFVGLSIYDSRLVVTGQATEQPKKGKVERITESILARLSIKGILIGGGVSMLLAGLGVYLGPDSSNPYLAPTLLAGGVGGIVMGIQELVASRFPRLARWLTVVGAIAVVGVLYFFIRMFIYE
jgi:hypothetical protein